MNCDKRGRVYGIPHFNFQREDHVRALFQFASGAPIGDKGDEHWIMIHAANCADFDGLSKRPWGDRIEWVQANDEMIISTAKNPESTVSWWGKADAPFSFVAACLELAGIWQGRTPNYVTRLPVCFDGSCSGIQHLSMMLRDENAARLVNIIPGGDGEPPQDVYGEDIINPLRVRLEAEADDTQRAKADFWLRRLAQSDARALVKKPMVPYYYNASLSGMARRIAEVENNGDSFYLAQLIKETAEKVLPGPTAVMKFIRDLAGECVDKSEVLEWVTPTGFPWALRYFESKVETVYLKLRGERVRHLVADGYEPVLRRKKSMNAAAPNFVHALDAAHLIRVVNMAVSVGIPNLAVVHDSFGCLAPDVTRLHKIIRMELAKLYAIRDVLAELRAVAGSALALPPKGVLDPWDVRHSTYAFA
jgi:DNA-directed RNA polymerase, mitochondrial